MRTESTSVLVVGGGLVGTSAALFLAWRGVPTALVERHPGSSPHPRAIGYTPRTMELYRAVGLGDRIPASPPAGGVGHGVRRVRVESLAGQWFEEQPWTPGGRAEEIEYSPCTGAGIAQDRLEPILRDQARSFSADVRMSTELLEFSQDEDGVRAVLRGADGSVYAMRADYLIAADGCASGIRETLGIGCSGRGYLQTSRSVLFRADLNEYLRQGFCQFVIDQPEFGGFVTTYGDGRWLLFHGQQETDPAVLEGLVRRAIGRTDLAIEVVTTGVFDVRAEIAQRYREGRVLLTGDAAHTLPPNRGGYSANTGIEDAHNLAYKLAAVLGGQARPELLDTYEAERRPVAGLCHDQIFARMDAEDGASPTPIIDDAAMAFGYLYRSAAIHGAGEELPAARRPEDWAGQPGTRAPHLWLGPHESTLDLYQVGWVLLAEGEAWAEAVRSAEKRLGVPVELVSLTGPEFAEQLREEIRRGYGIEDGGACLVRPDGYIAWRAVRAPGDPVVALFEALASVSFAKGV
ncbi:FAD-dependent monooxygenase [Sciscionella marina]|uniref:FAD-dependent monooxygenase n=1 Tax=Sciscionella marina TaxID=508770 RepID=UPI00035D347C|nr:FAD-dependent monooxygenase [Sciscionella marina]